MSSAPFARFAIRTDGDLILGKNLRGLFRAGHVYEVTEVLGEYTIRNLGLSAASTPKPWASNLWGRDAGSLVTDGVHLYTDEEYRMKCEVDNE